MEFSKKAQIQLILFSLFAVVFAATVSSCIAPSDDPAPIDNVPIAEINSFLFTSKVEATHTIGTSPCPQKIAEIKTYCGKTGDSCTADSVAIINTHAGLDIKFENGNKSTSLSSAPQGSKTLTINFNCQVATSFSRTYKLEFYKNGIKVDDQDLEIIMNVK